LVHWLAGLLVHRLVGLLERGLLRHRCGGPLLRLLLNERLGRRSGDAADLARVHSSLGVLRVAAHGVRRCGGRLVALGAIIAGRARVMWASIMAMAPAVGRAFELAHVPWAVAVAAAVAPSITAVVVVVAAAIVAAAAAVVAAIAVVVAAVIVGVPIVVVALPCIVDLLAEHGEYLALLGHVLLEGR